MTVYSSDSLRVILRRSLVRFSDQNMHVCGIRYEQTKGTPMTYTQTYRAKDLPSVLINKIENIGGKNK
jgi:hypothetical protein